MNKVLGFLCVVHPFLGFFTVMKDSHNPVLFPAVTVPIQVET